MAPGEHLEFNSSILSGPCLLDPVKYSVFSVPCSGSTLTRQLSGYILTALWVLLGEWMLCGSAGAHLPLLSFVRVAAACAMVFFFTVHISLVFIIFPEFC